MNRRDPQLPVCREIGKVLYSTHVVAPWDIVLAGNSNHGYASERNICLFDNGAQRRSEHVSVGDEIAGVFPPLMKPIGRQAIGGVEPTPLRS